jgi:hypothetical protein
MKFFDDKDIGNHLLQFCPKVVKRPVYSDDKRENLFIYELVARWLPSSEDVSIEIEEPPRRDW